MLQSFDKKTSIVEQLTRLGAAKKPGRKHQKRPGTKAAARKKARVKKALAEKNKAHRQKKARVNLYWRGNLDQYP